MVCPHDRLRCTNNEFFCLKCGAQVASPFEAEHTAETAKPAEAPKRPAKHKAKKTDE